MAPYMQAQKAVLFHLLNFNLLMDLGKDPPLPTSTTTSTTSTSILHPFPHTHQVLPSPPVCHSVYGERVCFTLSHPFVGPSRPVVRPPKSPEEINTTFSLFTRRNYTSPVLLDPSDLSTILGAPFVANQPFRVVIHGYFSRGTVGWAEMLKGEFLRRADDNVVIVDWSKGAVPPYTQAVANIRLVGAQLAYLIYSLHKFADVPISTFHLIGHSLGAHLSGHTGTTLRTVYGLQLPRVTGLDPAEPYFNDTDPITRLDVTDAAFVDVIHTDDKPILGFPLSIGMTHPIGHLDFYPNGGKQPGCDNGELNCHHTRAITYFTESIRQSCSLLAVTCSSYQHFLNGECWGCGEDYPCSKMGLQAVPLPVPPLTRLYLETRAQSPHCGYHYRVSLHVSNTSESQAHVGEFAMTYISLEGHKDYSREIPLTPQSHYYGAGTVHRRVILTRDIGRLERLTIHFEDPTWLLPRFRPGIYIDSVTIEPLGWDTRWKWCFEDDFIRLDRDYVLTPINAC